MKAFLQQSAKDVLKGKDHDLWHKYVRSGEISNALLVFSECVIILQGLKKN